MRALLPRRVASSLVSRLEELDRIAIRVLQQDLLPTRSNFHLIAKTEPRRFQSLDPRGEVGDFKDDPIPPAGLLALSAGHRTGTRRARAAEDKLEMAARDLSECGQTLAIKLEAELLRIEVSRAAHILDLISDTPKASDEASSGPRLFCGLFHGKFPLHDEGNIPMTNGAGPLSVPPFSNKRSVVQL